jgi:hypothetical protein
VSAGQPDSTGALNADAAAGAGAGHRSGIANGRGLIWGYLGGRHAAVTRWQHRGGRA